MVNEKVEKELNEIILRLKEMENNQDLHDLESSRITEAIYQLEFLI